MSEPAGPSVVRLAVAEGAGARTQALGASDFERWCAERDRATPALDRARARWGTASIHA